MIVNSNIKPKSKTTLGVIRNLVLDFILYSVAPYMRNYPIDALSGQGTTQDALYIT